MRGKPDIYRLWLAGRWRFVYRIMDEEDRLRVLRVRRKEDIDYQSLDPGVSEVHQPRSPYGASLKLSPAQALAFREALEMAERLPVSLQDKLVESVRRHQLEQSRTALADQIAEARADCDRGEVRRGTGDEMERKLRGR